MPSESSEARRAVLIGNAPSETGAAALTETAEIVVRINDAWGFGGPHGTRTTHLFVVNCGGSMAERLANPDFESGPIVQSAGTVVLPIAPETDDLRDPPVPHEARQAPNARNHARAATARLEAAGKRVCVLPAPLFVEATRAAGHARFTPQTPPPSTGLIALVWLFRTFPGHHVHAFGFGFDGWDGHAWDGERACFAREAEAGRLTLHALTRASSGGAGG